MNNLENLVKIYSLLHRYKIERNLGIQNNETKDRLRKIYTIELCGKYDPTFHIQDSNINALLENIQYAIENCLDILRTRNLEDDLEFIKEEVEIC